MKIHNNEMVIYFDTTFDQNRVERELSCRRENAPCSKNRPKRQTFLTKDRQEIDIRSPCPRIIRSPGRVSPVEFKPSKIRPTDYHNTSWERP